MMRSYNHQDLINLYEDVSVGLRNGSNNDDVIIVDAVGSSSSSSSTSSGKGRKRKRNMLTTVTLDINDEDDDEVQIVRTSPGNSHSQGQSKVNVGLSYCSYCHIHFDNSFHNCCTICKGILQKQGDSSHHGAAASSNSSSSSSISYSNEAFNPRSTSTSAPLAAGRSSSNSYSYSSSSSSYSNILSTNKVSNPNFAFPTSDREATKRCCWTEAEVEALKAGVNKFGEGHWALMKRNQPEVLQNRTNMDLKNKWHNLSKAATNPKFASKQNKMNEPVDLIGPNSGLCKGLSKVQQQHVEFIHAGTNTSNNAGTNTGNNTSISSGNSSITSYAVDSGYQHQHSDDSNKQHPITQILAVFPDVDIKVASDLLLKYGNVNDVVFFLSSNSYQKSSDSIKPISETTAVKKRDFKNWKDAKSQLKWPRYEDYRRESLVLLGKDFRRVPQRILKNKFSAYNYFYYPTKKHIQMLLSENIKNEQIKDGEKSFSLLSRPRYHTGKSAKILQTHEQLRAELEWEKSLKLTEQEQKDAELAARLNEEEAAAVGAMIECGCCYTEATWEDMVQCTEGHLFCKACLKSYTQEKLFGLGVTSIKCMDSSGCDGTYPKSQLERALPKAVLKKFEQAKIRECVEDLKTNIPGLYTCPHCSTAAEVPEAMSIFECPNDKCKRTTCKLCDQPSHIPLRCDEVENDKERTARVSIEEKMTEVRVRTCPKCKTKFYKSDGCNKMTCRCGTKICYLCRKQIIDYSHFCQKAHCQHQRCRKCRLYTNSEYDDMLAVKEAGELMKQEQLKKLGEGKAAESLKENFDIDKFLNIKKMPQRPAQARAPAQNAPAAAQGQGAEQRRRIRVPDGRGPQRRRRANANPDVHPYVINPPPNNYNFPVPDWVRDNFMF